MRTHEQKPRGEWKVQVIQVSGGEENMLKLGLRVEGGHLDGHVELLGL